MATAGCASVGCSPRGGEKQVSLVLCELRVAEPPGGTEQARRAQTSSQLLQAGPGCGASHAWAWPSTRKGLEHTEQSPQPRGYPMEGTSPVPGAPGSRTCQQGAGGQKEERADQERPGGGGHRGHYSQPARRIRNVVAEGSSSGRGCAVGRQTHAEGCAPFNSTELKLPHEVLSLRENNCPESKRGDINVAFGFSASSEESAPGSRRRKKVPCWKRPRELR